MDAADGGEYLQLFVQLPHVLQKPFLKYLSLFRPSSGCQMQSSKADRLTRDFLSMVAKGYVSEKGKADRPCPPHVWAMGMERMQEQAATLTLPMKNHNYLRAIVWQLADQADAGRERQQHHEVATGESRARRQRGDEEMSETTRRYIEKHGEPAIDPEIAATVERMRQKMRKVAGD